MPQQLIPHQSDQRILDWLNEHCWEVAITRDLEEGPVFKITWDHAATGRMTEVRGPSLREAARKAMFADEKVLRQPA